MRKLLVGLAAIAMSLNAIPVLAQTKSDWILLNPGSISARIYFDPHLITRTTTGEEPLTYFTLAAVLVNPDIDPYSQEPPTSKVLYVLLTRCEHQGYSNLVEMQTAHYYDSENNLLSAADRTGQPQSIRIYSPGSIGYRALSYACGWTRSP